MDQELGGEGNVWRTFAVPGRFTFDGLTPLLLLVGGFLEIDETGRDEPGGVADDDDPDEEGGTKGDK